MPDPVAHKSVSTAIDKQNPLILAPNATQTEKTL